MNILLIGAGLVGQERLSALSKISIEHSIKFDIRVVDTNDNILDDIEKRFNVKTNNNLNDELVRNPDWIFICVPHSAAADITINSFNYSKNIVVEKPLGRNLEECDRILEAKPDDVDLHVGLNYRFYLGINLLLNHVRKNLFGDLISVNMVLGHGNSPGMENSWKLDPIACGGGCLIDPGVHLLDIVLLLSKGELKVTGGSSWKGFWDTGIEEETHLVLQDSSNVIFNVQTSLNRWRSHFRVEVNGTKGYGIVSGRGRSYGHQSYITGRRWGWQSGKSQGESEVRHIDNHVADDSFYECMLALFSLSSWKIQDSEIYPCDHIAGRKIMSLLKKCRNELQITDTV
jgi:predicted dehydrogenase